MKLHGVGWSRLTVIVLAGWLALAAGQARGEVKILTPKDASKLETLAARETVRYFYLHTGCPPAIVAGEAPAAGDAIVIARKDRPAVAAAAEIKDAAGALAPEQYILKTITKDGRKTLWIIGGDDVGTLYGAYRFAEALGVRFYLHGDVIPDAKINPEPPAVNETGKPLFVTRGIQPFHDFPEGPDWWDRDDTLPEPTSQLSMWLVTSAFADQRAVVRAEFGHQAIKEGIGGLLAQLVALQAAAALWGRGGCPCRLSYGPGA